MELDNLKTLWQQQGNENVPQDIQPILKKNSNGPVAKMKRNLRYELWVVIVAYGIASIYFFVAEEGLLSSLGWVYVILGFLFVYYFIRKYRLLNSMECMSCQVKANLSRQVTVLEKYVFWYEIAGTAIIPLFAIYTFWYMVPKLRYMNGKPDLNNNYTLFWIVGTILFTILFYYLNKCYVNKLYGKHIKKLKLMLEQMDDQ